MSTSDEAGQIEERRAKLAAWRKQTQAYPNTFSPSITAEEALTRFGECASEQLLEKREQVRVAGRIMAKRDMGKTLFLQLQDRSGRLQAYVRADVLGESITADIKTWDLGDVVGVSGYLFKTKTGELSVHAETCLLLVKALRPMPDKFYGLNDRETCYRKRYLDLIANASSKRVFVIRSQVVQALRQYLLKRDFLEVETPMMHPIPGGAQARPFVTHHASLDRDLYLRIAPELYLKRLLVGGFERVFEINRCFRNEGLSTRHNPEFTTLEYYEAYARVEDAMDDTENMMRDAAMAVHSSLTFESQGVAFDFSKPFMRYTLAESLIAHLPDVPRDTFLQRDLLKEYCETHHIAHAPSASLGELQLLVFEEFVESRLIQPTFITHYPAETSPLARRNDQHPELVDRFELFVLGRELANSFSELNDPDDQAERFKMQAQAKAAGDNEAMHYDEDFITALEYGMPPAVGMGMGIDRLVMLLADQPSIRDVILFPQLREG